MNADSKQTFFELHCFALRFLYMLWQIESNKKEDQFPAFNRIMNETWSFVGKIMDDDQIRTLEALKLRSYQVID